MKKILNIAAKNFKILLIAQVIYKALIFITFVLMARFLGVQVFGRLSFVIAFVGLFSVVLDLGMGELLIKEGAGQSDSLNRRYIENAVALKLVLSFLVCICLYCFSFFMLIDNTTRIVILILSICLVLDSFTIFLRFIFRLFERMEFEALSIINEGILKFILISTMLKSPNFGILFIACIFLLVSVLTFLLTFWISASRFIKFRIEFDIGYIRTLLKKTAPFAFLTFFGVVNFKISTVMLSYMTNDINTGWYSAAVRLIEPVLIIPILAYTALFPTLARLYKTSRETAIRLFRITLIFFLSGGILVTLILNIFARGIIFMVLGQDYLDSIRVFHILSISLIAFFLKFFLERFLLMLNRVHSVILSYAVGIFVIIFSGPVLIKAMGYAGVAAALVMSEFFMVGCNLFAMRDIKNV